VRGEKAFKLRISKVRSETTGAKRSVDQSPTLWGGLKTNLSMLRGSVVVFYTVMWIMEVLLYGGRHEN